LTSRLSHWSRWAVLGALLLAPAEATAASDYRMTIYVDDVTPYGHVFFNLTDGERRSVTLGFYSGTKSASALIGQNGGRIADDSHHDWTVRQSYRITADGYRSGLQAIGTFWRSDPSWSPAHHCGDFTEAVAHAAGVPITLPCTLRGRNRPGVFSDYLLAHGGTPNPAYHAPATERFFTLAVLSRKVRTERSERVRIASRRADLAARLEAIRADYDAHYRPAYAEYDAQCNVNVPEDQVAARQAECDEMWAKLERVRLFYESQRNPYADELASLDERSHELDTSIASDLALLTGTIADLDRLHVAAPECPREDTLTAADCILQNRGTVQ